MLLCFLLIPAGEKSTLIQVNIDDLSDDPELAFTELVDQFDDLMKRDLQENGDNEVGRQILVEHMNNVLAAARALDIDFFRGWSLPAYNEVYTAHSEFSLAVKRYVLEIKIRKKRVTKIYSVALDSATRTKIQHYIKLIRDILEQSDLSERKRNALFAKLNAFAADVDRNRTRFENAMLAIIDLTDVARRGTETLKPITDLVNAITGLIGEAKSAEPESEKLPAPEERKKIEGPKTALSKEPEPRRIGREMDDEIPF